MQIEIKRVLESLYGFEVEKVQTLNMDGKKKKRGGLLIAKPDYKKAYVTLKNPLSISPELYPIRLIEQYKQETNKQSKSSIVEDGEPKKTHWLDDRKDRKSRPEAKYGRGHGVNRTRDAGRGVAAATDSSAVKFPWSSMKSFAGR